MEKVIRVGNAGNIHIVVTERGEHKDSFMLRISGQDQVLTFPIYKEQVIELSNLFQELSSGKWVRDDCEFSGAERFK